MVSSSRARLNHGRGTEERPVEITGLAAIDRERGELAGPGAEELLLRPAHLIHASPNELHALGHRIATRHHTRYGRAHAASAGQDAVYVASFDIFAELCEDNKILAANLRGVRSIT